MVTYSQLYQEEAVLISRVYKKDPGSYNVAVPAGAKWLRASARGAGGQGDHWGGGAAMARSRVPVTAGDNLIVQVGTLSTSSTPGDSFVKRNDGTPIVYADRGRGAGVRGKAANSVGDITRDGGDPGASSGGAPATDAMDYAPVLGGVLSASPTNQVSDPGGGGLVATDLDENSIPIIVGTYPAGPGIVCLEFFDSDPGY